MIFPEVVDPLVRLSLFALLVGSLRLSEKACRRIKYKLSQHSVLLKFSTKKKKSPLDIFLVIQVCKAKCKDDGRLSVCVNVLLYTQINWSTCMSGVWSTEYVGWGGPLCYDPK